MGFLVIALWAGGLFLAYCLVAINPREDEPT